MSKAPLFAWIDDDPQREKAVINYQSISKVRIRFLSVRGKSLVPEIQKIMIADNHPDLFLVDHKLDKVSDGPYISGSTVAEILREKWRDIPIVCVTAVSLLDIAPSQRSIYDAIIPNTSLSSSFENLKVIAKDFATVGKSPATEVSQILKYLRAPSAETDRLLKILPDEVRSSFGTPGLARAFYRWVLETLVAKPGFLYDRLWAATFVGLTEKAFTKSETTFAAAEYKGFFKMRDKSRWWQSSLRDALSKSASAHGSLPPWELGHCLAGISRRDHSKCYVCGREFPETVGFTDESCQKRAPMHLHCSSPHPNMENLLYFEDIRIMIAAS